MNNNETNDIIKSQFEIINTMDDTDRKIIDNLLFLYKYLAFLTFLIILIIWKIFFWDFVNTMLSMFNGWDSLSEGYKIAILTLIGGIPAGIFTAITSYLIIEKIKKYKKEK